MGEIRYPEDPQAREYLRDALRRQGSDSIDEIAAAIRERWHHSPLRSYRLAHEMSLEEVCKQVNRLLDVFAEEAGYFRHATLSRFEYWPTTSQSRRPSVSHLVALAQVYGTSPRNLIATADWTKLPQTDRYALEVLDNRTGGTEPDRVTGMMDGARPQAGDAPRTPPNWWAAPETIGSGNPIERLVTMANEESAQYLDLAGNVGPATLDQLRSQVIELSGRFANAPRVELFGGVRMLRDRIFGYLDGGQSMAQRRDLFFLAAATCGMLAAVSLDLGYPAAGMSQAQVGHMFAAEAGDATLTGWLYARQATICYWNSQPAKARDYARRGAALNPAGTAGVMLPALEAQACGELGDVESTRAAVSRAAEIRETVQPGILDQFGGLMGLDQAKQHYCATGAFLSIGDYDAAVAEAEMTIENYQRGPDTARSFDNMVIVQFQAAIAQVRTGDLDAAAHFTQDAFTIVPGHRDARIDTTAKRLHQQLCGPAARTSPLATGIRDQVEDFLSVAPARLELS